MFAMRISPRGINPPARRGLPIGRYRDLLIGAGVLLAAAAFLFLDAHPLPILLWDESRNIVNALEMDRTGFSLVTTYQGSPDLWNTKPPLMIWLMVASVRLFGASEWTLRLPGMLASLGTLTIVMLFVRRISGSIWTAVFAASLLVLSPAWLGEHGARTADYDSLLTFFVTGYLLSTFGAVHRARPSLRKLALIGICIIGAIMTKSTAGVIPGLGAGLYLLTISRVPRLWRIRGYALTGMAVVATVALFLIAREMQGAGYLAASWYNDVDGRYTEALQTAPKPATFYLADLWAGYFSATFLLIVSPIALRWMMPRSQLATIYCLAIAVTYVLVISSAASKLHHYVLPVLPFMAIVAALTFRAVALWFLRAMRGDSQIRRLAAASLAVVAVVPLITSASGSLARRYLVDTPYEGAPSRLYGALFERLASRERVITVVDPGFLLGDQHYYAPVLLSYRLLWARRGVSIVQVRWPGEIAQTPGIVATCKPEIAPALLMRGPDIAGVPGCAAIERR